MERVGGDELCDGRQLARRSIWKSGHDGKEKREEKSAGRKKWKLFKVVSEISMVIIRGGEEGRAVDSPEDSGIKKERKEEESRWFNSTPPLDLLGASIRTK